MIDNRISPSTLKAISEAKLYTKISNFLIRNYLFINFDLHQIFGSGIYWISKNAYQGSALELNKSAEELWHEGALDDWQHFSQDTVKMMYDEFVWQCLEVGRISKKRLIKSITSELITSGELTKQIIFSPVLKRMMTEGRIKVPRVRPLTAFSARREKVELNQGDRCYFSWHRDGIANPAFVYSSSENSYRLLFFTNCKQDIETTVRDINYARFLTVPKDQVGLNPMQAVLQKFH